MNNGSGTQRREMYRRRGRRVPVGWIAVGVCPGSLAEGDLYSRPWTGVWYNRAGSGAARLRCALAEEGVLGERLFVVVAPSREVGVGICLNISRTSIVG